MCYLPPFPTLRLDPPEGGRARQGRGGGREPVYVAMSAIADATALTVDWSLVGCVGSGELCEGGV